MNASRNYGQTLQGYTQRAMGFLNSDGLIPQIVITIIVVIIMHALIAVIENVVEAIQKFRRLKVEVFPYTYPSKGGKDGAQEFIQKANGPNPLMWPSDNELNGMEFSYSSHIYVEKDNFDGAPDEYRVVFYKGSKNGPGRNMAPGVFMNANTNKMRIYMASTGAQEPVEISNIPINKWFHLAIVMKGKHLDVFVNGNIVTRHDFATVPVLNYSTLYLLSTGDSNPTPQNPTVLFGDSTYKLKLIGAMQGMVSRLNYYSYAMSFSEIDSAMSVGPSSKIITTATDSKNRPPYLHDSWWVTNYN
jgi:Concanavalin A-like lectin/glucanases superfamily